MLDFIERHPALMTALVWPALTLILTALFKPKTPEQYAAMPPRLAAFLKLVGALGFDGPNAVEAIKQGLKNRALSPGVYRATRSSPLPEAVTVPELPASDTPVPPTRKDHP